MTAPRSGLNCYDAVLLPAAGPNPRQGAKAAAAKSVTECKFHQGKKDERLTCYNGFVESMPKPAQELESL